MNMKSTGGFTLVELIVVIAILAILAGVAVPAYSGYLNSAEKAGDITKLSAIKTAAVAALATEGEVTKIVVEEAVIGTGAKAAVIKVTYKGANNTTPTVEISSTVKDANGNYVTGHEDFKAYVTDYASLVLKSGAKATWENGEWKITE